MYKKVNGLKSLRDQIYNVFASLGMELIDFDVLGDDYTTLYVLRASSWDFDTLQAQEFRGRMGEVLPDAECICSQEGANAFIIFQEEL